MMFNRGDFVRKGEEVKQVLDFLYHPRGSSILFTDGTESEADGWILINQKAKYLIS